MSIICIFLHLQHHYIVLSINICHLYSHTISNHTADVLFSPLT